MKASFITLLAFLLCLSTVGADKKLLTREESAKIIEESIRKELNKPKGELTKTDFGKVTRLDLSFTKIMDTGFKKKKLTKLKKTYMAWPERDQNNKGGNG